MDKSSILLEHTRYQNYFLFKTGLNTNNEYLLKVYEGFKRKSGTCH